MKAKMDKESLNAAIRAAVAANGGKRVTFRAFLTGSGWSAKKLYRHYQGWEEALCAAGFAFPRYHDRVQPETLLALWGEVARKLGRLPTTCELAAHSPGHELPYRRRFGSWLAVPDAFRKFARNCKEWDDVVALVDGCPPKKKRTLASPESGVAVEPPPQALRGRPIFGDQLDFPSMRHAPSNELGVVYLFGMMAEQMGFAVERMQSAFPDCLAKRRIHGDQWQSVAIEFEYQSRSFYNHRHDPARCDIIVCWQHNWPECPENLEVIALREEIKRLNGGRLNTPL